MTPWRPLALVFAILPTVSPASDESSARDAYRRLAGEVSEARIGTVLENVSRFGSRLAGSEGERRTLEFVEREFRRLGLRNIRREPFEVTVPDPNVKGSLRGEDWHYTVLPMWPNLVRTSTCDVEGPLVYGRDGSLSALSGKRVEGAIVLLEFDSGPGWRNAASLGAKAILFIEPPEGRRTAAERLFSSLPHDAPRFWLPIDGAGPVLGAAFKGGRASLRCRQDWVVRETFNVVGEAAGTDASAAGEPILVSAHADAMSVVPGLAPGAESSAGIVALLELARAAANSPSRRPIHFMASAAHGLALAGERAFVDRRLRTDRAPYLLCASLDLSSGGTTLGSFATGWFYDVREEARDVVRGVSRAMRAHADRMADAMGAVKGQELLLDSANDSDGRTWRNNVPGKFAFGCEPFLQARYNAMTFATVDDARQRVDTPFDTIDHVRSRNIVTQTQTLACVLWHLANDTTNPREPSEFKVSLEPRSPRPMSLVGGFATLEGRVVRFDPYKSFTPDVAVPGSLVVLTHRQRSLMGVRSAIVERTKGAEAAYRIAGAPPVNSYGPLEQGPLRLSAFSLETRSGAVLAAPSDGMLGKDVYPTTFWLRTSRRSAPIVVFDCVATSLFGLTDPHEMFPLWEPRILDGATNAEPRHFGFLGPGQGSLLTNDLEDGAVLFSESGTRWKLLMGTGLGDVRLALTNASQEHPEGTGYAASNSSFGSVPIRAAADLIAVNESRLKRFASYRIVSPSIEELQATAKSELDLAVAASDKSDWAAAERHGRAAWGYALRVHPVIQSTGSDLVAGVVFYLLLLLPFAHFVERLLFASRSLVKQLLGSLGVFVVGFLALRVLHPAFELVEDPSMIFVAFVMGVLSLVVIAFIVGKLESSLKNVRVERGGVREVDVRRSNVAAAAFALGIGNMRRRRMRTLLTVLTIAVMTFIVLSFTSIVPEVRVSEVSSDTEAPYPGLVVRGPGLETMQDVTYRTLANHFEGRGEVARRAWYYGADVGANSTMTARVAGASAPFRAILGLDSEEASACAPQKGLLPGGRWFRRGESRVAIVPASAARKLKVAAADAGRVDLDLLGERFRVIGIVDDEYLRGVVDLDGDGLLPADFALSSRLQAETRSQTAAFRRFLRLDPSVCVLLPADDALEFGADIRTIAVSFPDGGSARRELDALMPRLRMNIYGSVPEGDRLAVRMFSVRHASKSTGLGLVLVQMLLASVFVLGTMAASVYERTREIGIFSAIGLAPNHIAVLFFAESAVYGVLGAVLGYFGAQAVSRIILSTGALPGLYLNFSASPAIFAALVVMAVVLASTIYPARLAARIAAPAFEEDESSEGEGDVRRIAMPFSLAQTEVPALLRYLEEWLSAHREYAIGEFVTSETSLTDGKASPSMPVLRSTVWVAPYDLGVSQEIELSAEPTAIPDVFRIDLQLERLGGEPENWSLVNRRFTAQLRRQFLTWRTLSETERNRYDLAPIITHSESSPA